MSACNVSSRVLRDVSLQVRSGEIVGLSGLLGMGHDHVLYVLFGAEAAESGTVALGGATIDLPDVRPAIAKAAGLALLPADRLRLSGVGPATVTENVTLPSLGRHFSRGFLRHRRETRTVKRLLRQFDVQPSEPRRALATLSGGNQQKALLAKWFAVQPRVLLLHEPTQGVDVGARRQIFTQIRDLAAAGTAVIMASTEYQDLALLCDRVIVFRDGRTLSELRGARLTIERLIEECYAQAS